MRPAALPAVLDDPQEALLAELVAFMTRDTPSVQHVLELAAPHLRMAAGLTAATVFELDSETGLLNAGAQIGEPGRRDMLTAGKVFRMAAGAAPLVTGEQMAVRLRIGGQTVGVLLLTGTDLAALRPEVLAEIALHFATTAAGAGGREAAAVRLAHRRRPSAGCSSRAWPRPRSRRPAASWPPSTAEAFRTEYAALYLIDGDGRIRYVHSVGLPDGDAGWRRTWSARRPPTRRSGAAIADGRPALVGDVATTRLRPGGLIETMGLRSLPGDAAAVRPGPVGMIMCGDTERTRDWTSRDRCWPSSSRSRAP